MHEPATLAERELIGMTDRITPDLLRYGWASAAIETRPELLSEWAGHPDTAIRRAVMRSPQLTEAAAELVVATRRSGLHTLGSNPLTPIELIEARPAALRRRHALESAGADDLGRVAADPNHIGHVELGSPTIDLVLARSERLDADSAAALAGRSSPRVDPWVAAVLWDRFGDAVRDVIRSELSAERLRATRHLVDEWLVQGNIAQHRSA